MDVRKWMQNTNLGFRCSAFEDQSLLYFQTVFYKSSMRFQSSNLSLVYHPVRQLNSFTSFPLENNSQTSC